MLQCASGTHIKNIPLQRPFKAFDYVVKNPVLRVMCVAISGQVFPSSTQNCPFDKQDSGDTGCADSTPLLMGALSFR